MEKKRMSRAPAFPPKKFYRIRYSSDGNIQEREAQRLKEMIEGRSTSMTSKDSALRFARGNGLVVASWDRWDPSSRAQVKALGVVVKITDTAQCIVKWIPLQRELHRITLRGEEHWDKEVFEFAPNVAQAFGLAEMFAENMADPFALPIAPAAKGD